MKTGTIVFITSVPPFSRYHGNIKRINDLILDMAGMGHQVHVCYHRDGAYLLAENFPPGVTWDVYVPRVSWRIAKRLRDRGIYWANRLLNRFGWFVNHPLDGWMDPAYVGYLRRTLAGRAPPAAVIAEYVWMTGAFAAFPEQTPKIVDTIDVFTERKKLCHSRGVPYHEFSLSARAEIKGLNRSDAVLAIAREELAFFQSRLKAVCSLYEPAFPPRARKAREGSPRNILFVASNNTANVKAGAALLAAWAQLPPLRLRTAHRRPGLRRDPAALHLGSGRVPRAGPRPGPALRGGLSVGGPAGRGHRHEHQDDRGAVARSPRPLHPNWRAGIGAIPRAGNCHLRTSGGPRTGPAGAPLGPRRPTGRRRAPRRGTDPLSRGYRCATSGACRMDSG
jgi:hypothetical protein